MRKCLWTVMAAVMMMAAVSCEKEKEKENSVRVLYLETSVIGAFEFNFSNEELADVITPLITYDIAEIVNNYEPEPVEGIPTIEPVYPIQKYIDANDLLTELFKTKYPCLNRAVICLDYLPDANDVTPEMQEDYGRKVKTIQEDVHKVDAMTALSQIFGRSGTGAIIVIPRDY